LSFLFTIQELHMRRFLQSSIPLLAAVLLSVTGCGDGTVKLGTVPVTGTVTQGGKPVEGAMVTFSPDGRGHAAAGTTDASGKFSLTTQISGDGAVPGTYKVMVSKFEQTAQPMTAEDDIDAAYAAAEAAGQDISASGAGRPAAGPKNLVPDKYASPTTSGLTATVAETGENNFSFEL
jgi:hypothetical protein